MSEQITPEQTTTEIGKVAESIQDTARARAMAILEAAAPTLDSVAEGAGEKSVEGAAVPPESPAPEAAPTEEGQKVSKALARIAKAEARLHEERKKFDGEKQALEKQFERYKAIDSETTDIVADTVKFLESRGISDADQDVIIKQLLKKRLGEKAPPTWNAEIEAKRALHATEKLREETAAAQKAREAEEIEKAKVAEVQEIDKNLRTAIAQYEIPATLQRVRSYVADSPEEAREAMRVLGYEIARANPNAERITLAQIAQALEGSLEKLAKYAAPNPTQESPASKREPVTTLSAEDVSSKSTAKPDGWDIDRARKRAAQLLEEYYRQR